MRRCRSAMTRSVDGKDQGKDAVNRPNSDCAFPNGIEPKASRSGEAKSWAEERTLSEGEAIDALTMVF